MCRGGRTSHYESNKTTLLKPHPWNIFLATLLCARGKKGEYKVRFHTDRILRNDPFARSIFLLDNGKLEFINLISVFHTFSF